MSVPIPGLAVFLIALVVAALAIYRGSTVVAAISLSVAAVYAAVFLWRRRNRKER